MKRIALLLSFGFFVLTACNNPQSYSSENAKNQADSELSTVVGGKDVHGRQTATGEIWSELNRNRMQAFSVAQRLNPVGVKEGEAIISAFVLFSEDKSNVELFLREEKMVSTITERSEDNVYQGGEYKFDAHESVLYIKIGKRSMTVTGNSRFSSSIGKWLDETDVLSVFFNRFLPNAYPGCI